MSNNNHKYMKHKLFIILSLFWIAAFGMPKRISVTNASVPVSLQKTDSIKGFANQESFVYYTFPTTSIDSIKMYYANCDFETPMMIDSVMYNKGYIDSTKDSLTIVDASSTEKIIRFLSSSKKVRKDGIDIRKKMVLFKGSVAKNLYFDNYGYFQDMSGVYRNSDSLFYYFQKLGIIDKWEKYVQDSVLMKEDIVVFCDGTEPNEEEDEDRVYLSVEEEACFPGGKEAFEQWVAENVVFPAEMSDTHGNFIVMGLFTVNKDGSIEDIKVQRTRNEYFIKEVERLCKIMPRWKPARLGGKIVRGTGIIHVFFKN